MEWEMTYDYDNDALQQIVLDYEVVRLILERLARYKKRAHHNYANALARAIDRPVQDVKWALKKIASTGCGYYRQGSNAKARIEWHANRTEVAQNALPVETPLTLFSRIASDSKKLIERDRKIVFDVIRAMLESGRYSHP
jgi:hypothetical protein